MHANTISHCIFVSLNNKQMQKHILINILAIVRLNESHKVAKALVLNFERVAGSNYTLDIKADNFKIDTVQKIINMVSLYKNLLTYETVYSTTLRLHFNFDEI